MQAVLVMTVELGLAICGRFIKHNSLYVNSVEIHHDVFAHEALSTYYLNTVSQSERRPIFRDHFHQNFAGPGVSEKFYPRNIRLWLIKFWWSYLKKSRYRTHLIGPAL